MSTHTNEWFNKRGMTAYQYQADIIDVKIDDSFKRNGYAVLAAAPNAGKTLMSICYIEKFLSENPNARVLVLTHGTTVLRDQFYEELQKTVPSFSFCAVESGMDINDFDCQVCVALPQSLVNKDLPQFDLLVVDEAHQFYFIKQKNKIGMVEEIEQKINCKYKLFLTGTPSKFILNEYEIIPISVNTLHDNNQISDLIVEIATMNVDIKHTDYNVFNEIKTEFKETTEQTYSALDSALKEMEKRLKSFIKDSPKYYSAINQKLGLAPSIFGSIDKTMIACRNRKQARDVKQYFESKGIKCALSISGTDEDRDSSEIREFKTNPEVKILIVVFRGILGFNMPELENVIDMTGSQNLDRIFQLMARVTRKHPNGKKKLFIKVAGKNQIDYTHYIMTAVLCLCDDRWYTKYNGKNFLDLKIPIKKNTTKKEDSKKTKDGKKKSVKPIEFLGLPVVEFFKELLHKRNDSFSGVAYTSVKEVRYELFNLIAHSEERTLRIAKEYVEGGGKDFDKIYRSECVHAQRNGYLDKVRDIIGWKAERRDIEDSLDFAKEYIKNGGTKFSVEHFDRYAFLLRKGLKDELNAILGIEKRDPKSKEEKNLEFARNYKSDIGFSSAHPEKYRHAQKRGYIDKLNEALGKVDLTPKQVKESNLRKVIEYVEGGGKSFSNDLKNEIGHAKKNRYINEVRKITGAKERITPEERKKIILNHARGYVGTNYSKDFKANSTHARTFGYTDELNAILGIKKRVKWNNDLVYEDALKYEQIAIWQRKSGSAYNYARDNNLLEKCCAHMTCGRKNKKKKEEVFINHS